MGIVSVWRNNDKVLLKYFSIAVISIIIIHSKWYDWWGGWTFGSRALNDCIPFLSILLLPALDFIRYRKKMVPIFALFLIFSFFVQIIGAFVNDNEWNKNPNIDFHQERLWSWKDGQLNYYIPQKYCCYWHGFASAFYVLLSCPWRRVMR